MRKSQNLGDTMSKTKETRNSRMRGGISVDGFEDFLFSLQGRF